MSKSQKEPNMGTITLDAVFELIERNKDGSNLVILDIRPHNEFKEEHIQGAQNLDYDGHHIRKKVEQIDKDKNYIISCKSGVRGEYFMGIMKDLGFGKVYNILGGFVGWKVSKLPLVK